MCSQYECYKKENRWLYDFPFCSFKVISFVTSNVLISPSFTVELNSAPQYHIIGSYIHPIEIEEKHKYRFM